MPASLVCPHRRGYFVPLRILKEFPGFGIEDFVVLVAEHHADAAVRVALKSCEIRIYALILQCGSRCRLHLRDLRRVLLQGLVPQKFGVVDLFDRNVLLFHCRFTHSLRAGVRGLYCLLFCSTYNTVRLQKIYTQYIDISIT